MYLHIRWSKFFEFQNEYNLSNYNNATGHLIYQEYSERGFNNVPGNNWPDSNYVKYKPED